MINTFWEWWSNHWLRFQAIAAPIGSLLVTLGLSQIESVGWWWNSWNELEVAASFASIGVLFYTASFASLEMVVILMVLGWKVKEYFSKKEKEANKELLRSMAKSGDIDLNRVSDTTLRRLGLSRSDLKELRQEQLV